MRSRLTKVGAFLTLAAALAVGGATLASASSKAPQEKAPAAGAVDTDTIQQGDQGAPDGPAAPAAERSLSSSKAAPSKSAAKSPSSGPSSSQPSEQPGEVPGSEVPGNDGPGGHADEPGNPNADHQFQGAE